MDINTSYRVFLTDPADPVLRLDYLHYNPVRSGLVWEPWHYKFSSAIDYFTNEKGLIQIDHLK
ncbi:MAG: hypothetical protein ABJA78_16630 [Ferruginibacter sp.]